MSETCFVSFRFVSFRFVSFGLASPHPLLPLDLSFRNRGQGGRGGFNLNNLGVYTGRDRDRLPGGGRMPLTEAEKRKLRNQKRFTKYDGTSMEERQRLQEEKVRRKKEKIAEEQRQKEEVWYIL